MWTGRDRQWFLGSGDEKYTCPHTQCGSDLLEVCTCKNITVNAKHITAYLLTDVPRSLSHGQNSLCIPSSIFALMNMQLWAFLLPHAKLLGGVHANVYLACAVWFTKAETDWGGWFSSIFSVSEKQGWTGTTSCKTGCSYDDKETIDAQLKDTQN